ncbi:hypothetical protein VNO77_35331 [Canavalia gladiata]|uniref:Uncharacterized protein n=1 Tax=Canavalia gladiata TaxID=3824 RepID=A0AAN9PXP1_CANGL
MDLFSGYIWIFLSKLVQTLLWVFPRITMRYCSHEAINTPESGCSKYSRDAELNKCEKFEEGTNTIQLQQEYRQSHHNDSYGSEPVAESNEDSSETLVTNYDGNLGLEEDETTKLVFKFQYQTWNCSEEFKGGYSETLDSLNTDSGDESSASNKKYEFISGKSFSLLDEQEPSSSNVKESCAGLKKFPMENDFDFLSERCVDAVEKFKVVPCIEQLDEHQVEKLNNNVFVEEISAADNFLSEDDFICLSLELDSINSIGDKFLLDIDFGNTAELDTVGNNDEENAVLTKKDLIFEGFDDEDRDKIDEIRKLEEKGNCFQDTYSITLHSSTGSDLEDWHKFDVQWEHQDLIEQLKMELNKVRATGLPTIYGNCESPRIMEDLKPWKIDEKFKHDSVTNELPKFYKSYIERMRKFDILNYQKLYVIGSLKTKDMLQSFSSHENSSPAITSFLPHIFHHSRHKKSESDPLKKFMREFYSDLEMVYVGQLCLSWEFLQWEYENALELWESDQFRLQSYNEVAEEFLQFQVLLQRFIENEPFQGPRVEYYARNRCVMRNFLQVPVIREDSTKEEKKLKTRDEDKDEITSDMLIEILEESIRTMWRFIRTDKDASSLTHKGPRETQVQLQDPADSEFLMEIQAELQKLSNERHGKLGSSSTTMLKQGCSQKF